MNAIQQELLSALKAVINNTSLPILSEEVKIEAQQQAVYSLICSNSEAIPFMSCNAQMLWEQQELSKILNGIPYVVIKGAAISIYYSNPFRRTMGDIDILVSENYYKDAKEAFLNKGYRLGYEDGRHVHFYRNNVIIELHRKFATLQSFEQERILDDWLINSVPVTGKIGKYSFPMLNDRLNGLVLLTHINQHIEDGIGLRHIVDWVIYVRKFLSDTEWPAFKKMTDVLGLTKLAKVVARLGQMYLGVSEDILWCADVSDETIDSLLEYIYECGNFGRKDKVNNTIVMVLSHGWGISAFFRNLQRQGERNWKVLNEYPHFRPLAWMYQLVRYISLGIKTKSIKDLRQNIASSSKRYQLMKELGVTRLALRKKDT